MSPLNDSMIAANSLADEAEHKAIEQAYAARRLSLGATPASCAWVANAIDVPDDMDALELVSGDAPYMLEDEDFGPEVAWLQADVPLDLVDCGVCRETAEQREERLQAIRAVPSEELYRPILELNAHRCLRLIDGHHRIAVFRERGQLEFSALVKCPADVLSKIRQELQSLHRQTVARP